MLEWDREKFSEIVSINCDGTHRVSKSSSFVQLYTISVIIKSSNSSDTMSTVRFYTLLKKKTKKVYKEMISGLKSIADLSSLKVVRSDFEAAFAAAVAEELPWVSHRYCSFHLSLAISTQFGSMGLKKAYDSTKGHDLRAILCSLSYIPCGSIVFREHVLRLVDSQIEKLKLSRAFPNLQLNWSKARTYLHDVWLGANPMFDPTKWAMETWKDYCQMGGDTTNNISEEMG